MTFSTFISSFWSSTRDGLIVGSIYALVALGYTLVYGVLRLINFANSEVFMLSAFGSFLAVRMLGLDVVDNPVRTGFALVGVMALCLVVSLVIGGLSAVIVERVAYRPLRKSNAPRLVFLISAIGASFAISEAVGEWGFPFIENQKRKEYGLTKFFKREQLFKVFGADIYDSNVIVIVGAALMAIILVLFVSRSRVGRGIRAVAQDAETAQLMGVNVDRIILITFLVGGVMAGGAAFLYELHTPYARFDVGFLLGVKAFTAAVLGGIGNVKGALLGGVLLGLIEAWGSSLFGADQNIGTIGAFITLVLVLMFRPSGLLGESLGRSKA
ncbi:MAG: branched-chain amino acid ABC transporter permease [Ilumatobacteraceae bacterium]